MAATSIIGTSITGMSTTGTSIIDVENLRREYGSGRSGSSPRFEAVRGVTFSVRRGELFALLGTNGAGKTSTLEMLEGLALPSAGTVRVLGRDPARDRRAVRPKTGILVQSGGLPAGLTVAETTRMWAGTLTSPRPCAEALELVDLAHRAGVAVKQLSGGEKRRLDLALAILGRPEILFLDEPTSGLDPESRRRTRNLLRHLLDEGGTVFLTTHDLTEAEDLADRLAILHRGRIVRMGTPAEVTAAEPASIAFSIPAGSALPDVAGIPGAIGRTEAPEGPNRRVEVSTRDLQASLTALLGWAAAEGFSLDRLHARPASLEETFLGMAATDPRADADQETTEKDPETTAADRETTEKDPETTEKEMSR